MSGFLTPQALAAAGPLVLETFFKHYLFRNPLKHEGQAREDLMYDEAFVLMKTFLEIATTYPLAALQHFGLVRTPAPPWVGLHRILITHYSLDMAAEYLIKAFGGKEMAYKIAGGSKWWQVRAGPGVEGEWIIMKKDWKNYQAKERDWQARQDKEAAYSVGLAGEDGGAKENGEFRKEMDELRCMLYIHGGAYYWGSINTHRYTIWRYARKMHGRCFAVNYRKAPQYPFPCAIQDCLAAYLYLVKPPPDAKHRPVHPKNIIIGGDSAGGGLVLALLQILRDTEGLELPAGAVLISPWSDMTHSFPSLLKNTATDIVPPYGFLHKPSSLWPPPPPELTDEIQSKLRNRVQEAISKAKGGVRDRRASITSRFAKTDDKQSRPSVQEDFPRSALVAPQKAPTMSSASGTANEPVVDTSNPTGETQENGHDAIHPITEHGKEDGRPAPQGEPRINPDRVNPGLLFNQLHTRTSSDQSSNNTTLAQCDLPLRLHTEEKEIEINTQCQIYATNAQLCHPWVSPILGYLGGLPPLFICAGNNEVLRDEIIYIAHKAAHPFEHPIRDDVIAQSPCLKDIERRYGPTNVHLQVYDGCGHDLPLFSMTKPARGVFRAIASFARYVTPRAPGSLSISRITTASSDPSSKISRPSSVAEENGGNSKRLIHGDQSADKISMTPVSMTPKVSAQSSTEAPPTDMPDLSLVSSPEPAKDSNMEARPDQSMASPASTEAVGPYSVPLPPTAPQPGSGPSGDDAGPRFADNEKESIQKDSRAAPGTAGYSGIYRGTDPFPDHMIRERVSSDGTCRPLEPAEKLAAMTMPRDEIGVIKEGAALRYLNGQAKWDKKYSRAIKTVQRHRRKNLKEAREKDSQKLVNMWKDKVSEAKAKRQESLAVPPADHRDSGSDTDDAGWGSDEQTAHDDGTSHERQQRDALDLPEDMLDQSWSWTWAMEDEAPPPSAVVSRRDFGEARQLALMADRMDSQHASPVHGLSIWVGLAAFFSNSSERGKAQEALKSVHEVKKFEKAQKRGKTIPHGDSEDNEGGEKVYEGKKKGTLSHLLGTWKLKKHSHKDEKNALPDRQGD